MTTVSFPGLGIGEFTMNKVAFSFSLFGSQIEVRWYGILITIGIILAILYASKRSKDEGIIIDDLLDMGIFAIISGVIGARIYYVLTYGVSNFIVREGAGSAAKVNVWKTFVSLIAVWNGGIAIYGAIIGGAIAVFFVCRHKKIKVMKAFDVIGPAVMIGQILGRWGNFVNGEAYGYEVEKGSLLYPFRMGLLPNIESSTVMHYFHPTFFYESLWNLIGFAIISLLYKRKKFDGQVFLMYITWYGFGRMFIEGLRTDSLYIGVFRISQVVGFCCFITGCALIINGIVKARKAACELASYEPVYPGLKSRITVNTANKDEQNNKNENAESGAGSNNGEASGSDAATTTGSSPDDARKTQAEDGKTNKDNDLKIPEDKKSGDNN